MSYHIAEVLLFALIVVGGPWLAVTVKDHSADEAKAR